MALQLATAGVNVARTNHYVRNPVTGLFEQSLLLEAARTNVVRWSADLTNAAWTKSAAAAQTGEGLDWSAGSATVLTDNSTAVSQSATQSVAVSDDAATHVATFWLAKDANQSRFPALVLELAGGASVTKRAYHLNTATGALTNETSVGTGTARVLDAGRFWAVELAVTNNTSGHTTLQYTIFPAAGVVAGTSSVAATGFCIVAQVQVELNAAVGSSPIVTTTTAVARGADLCTAPFAIPPQAMTAYVRFVELGSIATIEAIILSVGMVTITLPRVTIYSTGSRYGFIHQTTAGVANCTLVTAPALGDLVELRAVLQADGAVYLGQSINGAAETVTAVPSPRALAAAWATPTVFVGSPTGFTAILAATIVRGVKTLGEMRSLAR